MMEEIFSSNSLNIIEKKIEIFEETKNIEDLEFYFDIHKTAEWILNNQFKRVSSY